MWNCWLKQSLFQHWLYALRTLSRSKKVCVCQEVDLAQQKSLWKNIVQQLDNSSPSYFLMGKTNEQNKIRTAKHGGSRSKNISNKSTARVFFCPVRRLFTVFANHRKSLIQHCERSELRLHFEWPKVH